MPYNNVTFGFKCASNTRGLIERMSASQQKKKRQNGSAPLEQNRNFQAAKKVSGAWIAGGIGVIVLVVLAIFFGILNSGLLHKHTTAAVVGDHKISPVMYNYFYKDYYSQSYINYMTDPEVSLDKQYYDEENGVTWADYLTEQVNKQIAEVYAVCDAANAEGYTLSSEEELMAMNNVSTAQLSAKTSGMSDDAYLAQAYGTGSTVESFREYQKMLALADSYEQAHSDALTYTEDEIHAYFDEHQDSLISYSYRTFTCSVETGETDADGKAVIDSAASEELAKSIAEESQGDETAFAQLARDNAPEDSTTYESDDATLTYGTTASSISDTYVDWITDANRVYGDTTAVANDDGSWTAIMFVDSTANYTGDVVNVRHILVQPEDTEDDASWEEAKTQAQEYLDEYLAGDQTEDAFAEMATNYSVDSSALDGGLIEDIYPGQMVRAFNDWCFDPDRQTGDTGIVETSYGYHVMYFVGEGDAGNATDYRTTISMRKDDTSAWVTELGEQLTVVNNGFGMWLTDLG